MSHENLSNKLSNVSCVLFVLLCVTLVHCECEQWNQSNINNWSDDFVKYVVRELKSTDSEFLPVSDLKGEYVAHIGKLAVRFGIHATDGVVGELTSLRRTGDTSIVRNHDTIVVMLPLEFEKLGVHFDNCIVWCGTNKALDELEIKVPVYRKQSIQVRIHLFKTLKYCDFVQSSIGFDEFQYLDVILNNHCLSKLSEHFNNSVTKFFNVKVRSSIETKLNYIISKYLTSKEICI